MPRSQDRTVSPRLLVQIEMIVCNSFQATDGPLRLIVSDLNGSRRDFQMLRLSCVNSIVHSNNRKIKNIKYIAEHN